MKRITLGILAHVDAGKTTLTEALLYGAGELRRLGRVDHRDAFLDTHSLERSRGITIFSKQAILRAGEAEITLLDTPGHTDFSAETERVLSVLDYAILLVGATDGVQNHTETLWELLERYHIPVFIFVNKTDLAWRGKDALLGELRGRFGGGVVDLSEADMPLRGAAGEAAALSSEALMELFLEKGALTAPDLAAAIRRREIFPCFFGSALKLDGTAKLLAALGEYTLAPEYGEDFAARVFKIGEDEKGNRLTHLKVTGGTLRVRMPIGEGESAEKIGAIRLYSGSRFKTAEEVSAGTVCAVTGLTKTYAGEGLGAAADAPLPLLEPLFSYRVELPPGTDAFTALAMLRRLEEEDPALRVLWNERLREIRISLMGEIQT
ncbi:MAG: GTP-binding protein, partial [Eubacterium sp.]|nr:GTP-binding protein [Eubacterium sp.]